LSVVAAQSIPSRMQATAPDDVWAYGAILSMRACATGEPSRIFASYRCTTLNAIAYGKVRGEVLLRNSCRTVAAVCVA
jgi:hypothetical protein